MKTITTQLIALLCINYYYCLKIIKILSNLIEKIISLCSHFFSFYIKYIINQIKNSSIFKNILFPQFLFIFFVIFLVFVLFVYFFSLFYAFSTVLVLPLEWTFVPSFFYLSHSSKVSLCYFLKPFMSKYFFSYGCG